MARKVDAWGTMQVVSSAVMLLVLAGCGSTTSEPVSSDSGTRGGSSTPRAGTDVQTAFHEASPDPESVESFDSIAPASAVGSEANSSARAKVDSAKHEDPLVVLETSLGDITIQLFPENAPRTVANFLENYVARKFYDGTIIHHVEPDFMVAAGGYTEDLEAKPTRAWIRNEARDGLSNRRGTVAMARLPDYPDSATSQFFINLTDNVDLDYDPVEVESEDLDPHSAGYCVFGKVVRGMEVVERIAGVEVQATELFPHLPVETVRIRSARRIR